jgi:hypothetical protein
MVNGNHGSHILRDGEPFILTLLAWRDGLLAEAVSIVEPGKLARFHKRWERSRN